MYYEVIFFLVLGAIAGLVSGTIGIGGGIIIVPALSAMYAWLGVGTEEIMHYAIGTSTTTIMFTTLSSIWVHYQKKAIRWDILQYLLPGLLLGSSLGAWLTALTPTHRLKWLFGCILIFASMTMLRPMQASEKAFPSSRLPIMLLGLVIASVAALLGLGGGLFLVPALTFLGLSLRTTVALSSSCSFIVACAATIGHIIHGASGNTVLTYTTGYVHWVAVLGIIVTSLLSANLGAKLVHFLPEERLKRLFALLLMAIGLYYIYIGLA